jgi:shikimate dehydrogenase
MTYRIGIIGFPLAHTLSPVFQQAALSHAGLDAQYEVWETPNDQLDILLQWMRETPGIWGANVTVPHKEAVYQVVDVLAPSAEAVGAVNTVVVKDGKLTGHNTDAFGFLRALSDDGGFHLMGKQVLLLGAGGAARAVVAALVRSEVHDLIIANRNGERAEALARLAQAQGVAARAIELTDQALAEATTLWDLIVNTTSMGMRHATAEHQSPMAASLISSTALVYDLVYNPRVTPLLEAATAAGAKTMSGLSMLVYQGAESFTLWSGVEAPIGVMMVSAQEALSRQRQGG